VRETNYIETEKALTVSGGEEVRGNVNSALKRKLSEPSPALCSHDGTFVIVGSGPSLAQSWEGLKDERAKGRPICAVKGAHDFLVEKGIEPELFFSIDPRDRRNTVSRETKNTVYLLASRVAPVMFDHLKDRYVMIVHTGSADDENKLMHELGVKYIIGGMSTSGLRAVNVGYYLGFRNFVMYGMDSCNADDGITKRVNGDLTGQTQGVRVGHPTHGPSFVGNVAMAQQALDFQKIYQYLPDAHIEIKGGGLLAAIVAERKNRGYWT